MPQFWKLDALQWINPDHIVHVEEPYTLVLTGDARDRVLAYLARDAAPEVL